MPSQLDGVLDRTGLTPHQVAAAAWCVAPGVQVGGARAIALGLAVAWQHRLPLVPWLVPGVPALLDVVYTAVARHRHRLPGTTPWCVANPGCGDAQASAAGSPSSSQTDRRNSAAGAPSTTR